MKYLLCMLFALVVSSCGRADAQQSFMPENDLYKHDRFFANNMDEGTFNSVIDSVERVYAPIVARLGGRLYFERRWFDPTVNAYANREGNVFKVAMFGGLARRPEVTPTGFLMVVCHELGHHIAGAPLYAGEQWASNEGQSDYFAAHVCVPKVLSGVTSNVQYLSRVAVDKCKSKYSGQKLRVCYHTMSASKSVADLLSALSGVMRPPAFETPDTSVVGSTQDAHPAAQCRLDTMAAGTICTQAWNDGIIPTRQNEALYNCKAGPEARPRCWYRS